jgi:hypothetical protein
MKSQPRTPSSAQDWLLAKDKPGPRYLAMRNLPFLAASSNAMSTARRIAHREGPIALVLKNMHADGYWSKPGAGYSPKYFSTVWSMIQLAQLGGSLQEDKRIQKTVAYLLDHALVFGRQFSYSGAPAATIACLHGNLCWALLELGTDPESLLPAFDWMARVVTGEGIAPQTDRNAEMRYYAYTCGPHFACGVNGGTPCAWAAVKNLLAFAAFPDSLRTPVMRRAIREGAEFLLDVNPEKIDFPSRPGGRPNQNWWKFGFPVFYITDMLQLLEACGRLGYTGDKRWRRIAAIAMAKQDAEGRWPLEYHYRGKTWVDYGRTRVPNKWVTIRAMRALRTD